MPIPAEIRGRYRVWKTEIGRSADRIETMFSSAPFRLAAADFLRRTRAGREKAFGQLRRLYDDAGVRFIDREGPRLARWAYLQHTGEGWVHAMLSTLSRRDVGSHTWLLSFSDHALQRALQRSPPGLDLTALCWEAVDAARGLSLNFLWKKTTPDRFRIGAGDGAFACDLSWARGAPDRVPLIEANTWLANDQMTRLQELQVVPEGEPNDRFDDVYREFRSRWSQPAMEFAQ